MKEIKDLEREYGAIDIMVASKDRHTEVALMIQSLRTQTYKKWNLILLDDASGSPFANSGFGQMLLNRVRLEGHKVKCMRNDISHGVCYARNTLIKEQIKWKTNSKLVARLDDDTILESDYLERLVRVIESGYDIASGVVPQMAHPEFIRENKHIGETICYHELDEEGSLIKRNDDLGFSYLTEDIFPCAQFRTSCVYFSKLHEHFKYPTCLTKVGFREELWVSFQCIIKGFKIGVDVQAKAYHFQTPSGGCRSNTYGQDVSLDEETTNKWIKEQFGKHGNFLEKYYDKFK